MLQTDMLFIYCPLVETGLDFIIADIIVLKFSSKDSTEKVFYQYQHVL